MRTQRTDGVRRHFTYANVMSTLSVFLVIAGGTALAAKIKPDSVKSKSIKNGQVKLADLGANSVDSSKVLDDSLGGADINESQLTLPASPTSLPPSGPAGGSLAGTYPDPTLGANAVGAAEIANNSIATGEVVNGGLNGDDVGIDSVNYLYDAPNVPANSCVVDAEDLGIAADLRDAAVTVTPDDTWPALSLTTENSNVAGFVRFVICNPGPGAVNPAATTMHIVGFNSVN